MLHKLETRLRWLARRPTFHDMWTYCGVCIFDAIAAYELYQYIFIRFLDPYEAKIFSAAGAAEVAVLFLMLMGFKFWHAVIISIGCSCFGQAGLAVKYLDLSLRIAIGPMLAGFFLSAPLFCRGRELSRQEASRKNRLR